MKRRSLPRQQVDFTVKRQEMNMMHGYKKMLVVKQSLEKLLGVTVGEDFLGSLEDGIDLCQLMNKLHPGTIAHFHMPTDDQVSSRLSPTHSHAHMHTHHACSGSGV